MVSLFTPFSLLISVVVGRHRKSPFPMMSVTEALETVLGEVGKFRVSGSMKDVREALGFIVAHDVVSPVNIPPHDVSLVDGYAVLCNYRYIFCHQSHSLAEKGPGEFLVLDAITPERNSLSTKVKKIFPIPSAPVEYTNPNGLVRVTTGARVASPFDAVVMVEDTTLMHILDQQEHRVNVQVQLQKGENIRRAGSDLKKGEVIVRANEQLGVGQIATLISCGIKEVSVYRRPSVAVISSGNEISDLFSMNGTPEEKVMDTNRPMLIMLLKKLGYEVLDMGIVMDKYASRDPTLYANYL